ncbi:MAG: glutamine-synthetase adenylyltransferase, partial [Alphaproteobacteria bacterium]|nr:glutamine-synthetase adenylyltransferase [Alphaproteobacteria bacterium]
RPREDPDEAAVRIARRVVELMQARTGDGYVFRVDLRLRPSPEATPISLPVEAAESYYQSEALPWERAAFIRARACAGDIALGEGFLGAIRPFVWRRSLDYSAVRDIREISLRIRDHYDGGQAMGPGFDLKRGRGGIREVEFFAQIHQMIFGGREPVLRAPATLDALAALSAAGKIDAGDAAALAAGYRLLREVEHRVQMVDDEQTHALPKPVKARTALGEFCGFDGWKGLETALTGVTRQVAKRYDGLVAEAGGARLPRETTALAAAAKRAGFRDGAGVARLIEGWRDGRYRALRTAEAQHAFEAALPKLLEAFAALAEPDAALARADTFLAQLPSGVQFFELLAANPNLGALLARLLGVTPTLADALARKPELFDIMLDPAAFAPLPEAGALTAELDSVVGAKAGEEELLDRVRRWTAERRFQLGAQLLEGAADPLDAARGYAALADAAVAVLAPRVTARFAEGAGRVPGAELLVLGLGRYGGRALTARSDLDLIYLFSGAHDAESDGPRTMGATPYFNKLAQRLTAALSVPTAEGALYEVDTRLRPSGAQGLLAVSTASFDAYQRGEAWTWEHMALMRARVVLGGDAGRAAVAATVAAVVAAPRDPDKLRADVLGMRADMDAAKPGQGLWDVKLGRGGLVDLEFLVHYLQLRDRAGITPDLRAACTAVAPDLVEAHDLLTRLLVMLRLVVPDVKAKLSALSPAAAAAMARAARLGDAKALEPALKDAKWAVLTAWERVFGEARRGRDR